MATAAFDDEPPLKRRRSSSFYFLPPDMSELRVVLLGSSWTERKEVGNIIVGETVFSEVPEHCLTARTRIKDKDITVINTPQLPSLSSSQQEITDFIKQCVRLSAPGPHVFLLVLQPEDFTEEHKLRLCRVLESYSDQSFGHSLILISIPREEKSGFIEKYMQHPPLKDMIQMCRYRYLWHKKLELHELLTRLGQIATEKNGEHLSYDGLEGVDPGLTMTVMPVPECRPSLNLVLCGGRGAGKTLAVKPILGQTELHSVFRNFKKLQEEYEKERKEEEQKKKEQEETMKKEIELEYERKMDNMKKKHEVEAKKQTEEFNQFKEKNTKDFEALIKKHEEELKALKKQHEEEIREKQKTLCKQYEDEKLQELEDLKKNHKRKLKELKEKYEQRCTIC